MHYVITDNYAYQYDEKANDYTHHLNKIPSSLGRKNNSAPSVLAKKSGNDLMKFSWNDIVVEMKEKFPILMIVLCAIMVGATSSYQHILPHLGLIYGIVMKAHNDDLSLVQNMLSVCLFDSVSDQKVYERLSRCGISLCHRQSNANAHKFTIITIKKLVEAIRSGKQIRFIGDNLNFFTNVKYERLRRHGHMHHMFAIAAYIFNREDFTSKSSKPQISLKNLKYEDILLKRHEYISIRALMVRIITPMLSAFMPAFKLLSVAIRKGMPRRNHSKTTVIPLEVLPLNEMSYNDTVQIMLYMKKLAQDVYRQADKPFVNMHVGGDQLTRERFSHAKEMRLRTNFEDESLKSMYPVTTEFFHLLMNYLSKVVYHTLYTEDADEGTLHFAKQKLHRNNVDPNSPDKYNANKELLVSYVTATLLEAAMEYFGMESVESNPTKNLPANDSDHLTPEQALHAGMCSFVDDMILPSFSGKGHRVHSKNETQVCEDVSYVTLSNGSVIKVRKQLREEIVKEEHDRVMNYSMMTLELGMVYLCLLDSIKHKPDRTLMLQIVKMLLPIMKSRNSQAKYPLELLRFLVQQYCLLPEKEAFETFNACFVNTKGYYNSYVPADLQMEWIIRTNKRHLKHMYSNRSEACMQKRSTAIHCVDAIASTYDEESDVKPRSKKNKRASSEEDELILLQVLHQIKPFSFVANRFYRGFKNIEPSMMSNFDGHSFADWFHQKKRSFTP